MDFSLKIGYVGSFKFGYYYLEHLPACKPFDHAWFEVLEAITLYCSWSDNRWFQGKFRRILDKFNRRTKPIPIIGVPGDQRPDMWSSAVLLCSSHDRSDWLSASFCSTTFQNCSRYFWRTDFRYGLNPYPTAFPYGNGMVLHFYQQQESSTTKTVHKVIDKGLKTYV